MKIIMIKDKNSLQFMRGSKTTRWFPVKKLTSGYGIVTMARINTIASIARELDVSRDIASIIWSQCYDVLTNTPDIVQHVFYIPTNHLSSNGKCKTV